MRLLRSVCLIALLVWLPVVAVYGASVGPGRMFVDPDGRYYISLPEGWRATPGSPYTVCRPEADVSFGIAVVPTTNFDLDLNRLNHMAALWQAKVVGSEPYLESAKERTEAMYFNRPATHLMLRGTPPRARSETVKRLTVISCRGYAYFIYAKASSPALFDTYRATFDTMLESITDLSPALVEKILLGGTAMRMDPDKVPVHDFVLVNRNDFTVENIFVKVTYSSVQGLALETCLVRVNVRVHPQERLVIRNFQALPLRSRYDYQKYHTMAIELVDAARAFDQGMGKARSADSIVTYTLDLGGAKRATSPNDMIAFCRGTELWVMDGRARRKRRLYSGTSTLMSPAWSPDRRSIAVVEGGSLKLLYLDKRGTLEGSFPLLPEGTPAQFVERHWFSRPTWERDGTKLFMMGHKLFRALTGNGRHVVTRITKLSLGALSTDEVRVHANPDDFSRRFETFNAVVYCSPRSDLLAYTRRSPGAGTFTSSSAEIVFADFTGKVLRAVAVRGLHGQALAWSPDGKRIACVRQDSQGATNVYTLSLRDRKIEKLTSLRQPEGIVVALDWSPDGSWIVFDKKIPADQSSDLFKVHTRKRTVVRLTKDGVSGSPAWFGR